MDGQTGARIGPRGQWGGGGLHVAGGPLTRLPGRPPPMDWLWTGGSDRRPPCTRGRGGRMGEAGRGGGRYRCWPAAGWSASALPTVLPSSWRTWPAGIPTSWGRDRRRRESRAGDPSGRESGPGPCLAEGSPARTRAGVVGTTKLGLAWSPGPRHGWAEVWPPGSGEADQPLQAVSAFEGFRDAYGGTPFFKNFLTESLKPAQALVAKRTEVKGGVRRPQTHADSAGALPTGTGRNPGPASQPRGVNTCALPDHRGLTPGCVLTHVPRSPVYSAPWAGPRARTVSLQDASPCFSLSGSMLRAAPPRGRAQSR